MNAIYMAMTVGMVIAAFMFVRWCWRKAAKAFHDIERFNERLAASAKLMDEQPCPHEHVCYGVTVYPDGEIMNVCEDCGHGWSLDGTEHEGIVM